MTLSLLHSSFIGEKGGGILKENGTKKVTNKKSKIARVLVLFVAFIMLIGVIILPFVSN